MGESDDLREFIREMTIRFDRLVHEMREDNRLVRTEIRRHHDRQDRKLDELIEENRTQREALFRIFDRLDNGGGAATAG